MKSRRFCTQVLASALVLACFGSLAKDAAAAPTWGTWLETKRSSETQGPNLQFTWGPSKDMGWANVPSSIVSLRFGEAAYPLCATDSGIGWIGVGRSRVAGAKTVLRCETQGEDSSGAFYFENKAGRPAAMWISTTAQNPEPRGAIVLLTQESSRRRLFACQFDQSGGRFVGHIGDDGVCYGTNPADTPATSSTYLTLVTKGTGPDAQPRYGWVDAGITYTPHTPSIAVESRADGQRTINRQVCSASDGNLSWPGWVRDGVGCEYFTHYNNVTERKTATVYRLHRTKPGAPKVPFVFNRYGGKPYYACASTLTANGTIRDVMFGFTNNPSTCTNGRSSTDAPPRAHGWTNTTVISLPESDEG